MPSSSVQAFLDPEEFAAGIRAAEIEITLEQRGSFAANLTRIDLHRLWMQRFSESGPRIFHIGHKAGRAIFSFLIEPGPEVIARGMPVAADHIVRNGVCDDFFHRTTGPIRWAAMSLPAVEMTAVGVAMIGADLGPRTDAEIVIPRPAAFARLRRLHAAAGRLADDAPEIIENPEAARGLEQALIGAVAECLARGDGAEDRCAGRRHEAIMRRFYRALEAESDRALYLPELCAAIGVAERTLRVCCHEHLGVGPKQYLLLRRLHLAHRALGEAIPGKATVTDIATQFGFWQFGRFAGEYRALFGESPSATLRRQPA